MDDPRFPALRLQSGAEPALRREDGFRFDPRTRTWVPDERRPFSGEPVSLEAAVTWLQRESGWRLRPPVGVIGAREAGSDELACAEQVGRDLARLGLVVLTGGKGGIMEATCRGVEAEGGLSLGLLPDDHWGAANGHVGVPLASGLGVARNAVIARASVALIAVAGGYGTLSEMAFGLQFERPVLALPGAPSVAGAIVCETWEQARGSLCARILNL